MNNESNSVSKTPTIIYGMLLLAAFLFVFLFSCTTSPLYEHYPFWFHGDSGIFQEMGICLIQGGTPYVDLFDHKGPVLWFIQALGEWISNQWGLTLLQTIALFCTLLIWYKSSQLLVEKYFQPVIITFSGLFFLLAFYERGNLCEEWSLPFISLPIYLFVRRFRTATGFQATVPIYQHSDIFIMGLCAGIIAMIRLNNTAPIVGFALWHLIICLKQKEIKRMWIDAALIVAGVSIVFTTCALFYFAKAGLTGIYEMIYGTFVFNFIYISGENEIAIIDAIHHYVLPFGFLILICINLFHKTALNNIIIPLSISLLISILTIGNFHFWHYSMIFIPLIVITISVIVQSKKKWTLLISVLLFLININPVCDAVDHLFFRMRGKQADTALNDGFHRFISSIPSQERKSIYNAGLNHMGAGLFANENIYQCNRIIYKSHTDISPHLREYEENHGIKDIKPVWVLTQSVRPEMQNEYMAANYNLADSIPGGQFDPIWCWRKKWMKELFRHDQPKRNRTSSPNGRHAIVR